MCLDHEIPLNKRLALQPNPLFHRDLIFFILVSVHQLLSKILQQWIRKIG
jgi:hypothetical protein